MKPFLNGEKREIVDQEVQKPCNKCFRENGKKKKEKKSSMK